MEAELEKSKRKAEKYKKRFSRCRNKAIITPGFTYTPRTKTRKLLASFHQNKPAVRKTLVFHYALLDTIKHRYRDSKLERQKRTFALMFSGKILHKYKLQSYSYQQLGFSVRQWSKLSGESTSDFFDIRRRRFAANCRMMEDVKAFYLRDDTSRMTAGKKETVTKNKVKMQKRILTDTLFNIHLKFISEHPQYSISYSMFCRLRPFWVLAATERDRQTCLCKTQDNIQLIVDKLTDLRILHNATVERLCDVTVCNAENKQCMYGMCNVCADRGVPYCDGNCTDNCVICCSQLPHLSKYDKLQSVTYHSWINKVDIIDGKKCISVVKHLETRPL